MSELAGIALPQAAFIERLVSNNPLHTCYLLETKHDF